MSLLTIFTPSEQKSFDSPPKAGSKELISMFMLSDEINNIIFCMRSDVNKIGFMLQLGYFKATGKFFSSDQFRNQDILYLSKLLNIDNNEIDITRYTTKSRLSHKKIILTLQDWCDFSNKEKIALINTIDSQVEQQPHPKQLMFTAISFLIANKIVIPSYNYLSSIITDAYNKLEYNLINIINQKITAKQIDLLDALSSAKNNSNLLQIGQIKRINQSLKTQKINDNVSIFTLIKKYYIEFESVINALNLSSQATEYYATWVKKSKISQLEQFKDRSKYYLYVLAFLKHQFFYWNDILVDVLLKSVRSSDNSAKKQIKLEHNKNKKEQDKLILGISKERKDFKDMVDTAKCILKSDHLSDKDKISKLNSLLGIDIEDSHSAIEDIKIQELENDIIGNSSNYYNYLTAGSNKLQRKISNILQVLEFNKESCDCNIYKAIEHHKNNTGKINNNAPADFLNEKELKELNKDNKFNALLYNALLFIKVADGIKSGKLNVLYSYRYLSIFDYLIDKHTWQKDKDNILKTLGLAKFANIDDIIKELKTKLDDKYDSVNKEYIDNNNEYLSLNKKNKFKVKTPKLEESENKVISNLLFQSEHIPILQLLFDINNVVKFTKEFKHHSIKNNKSRPNEQTLFAGIIGKGCNLGISKLANTSKGLTLDTLKNAVTWYFDLKNIQEANNRIIEYINKLSLSNIYCSSQGDVHTSSDGPKANVNIDCLLANYSFKYFGKSKGVSIYTFIDEKQSLFYSTVISASEREASYVIDGLLNNRVIKSSIHSTDTHGFTELIFCLTYLIDISFAPRIKKVGDQRLYSFITKSRYEEKGYEILPKGTINVNLIKEHWDDILRFMATIKSKHATASILMKRLSSYAKHEPLYKALKEFGKIIKSIFILTYFSDVKLRQKMQKQLNVIELANKFSKAIFFANNQEFNEAQKEEQEIIVACRVLIQNSIILWNYLYLSQLIVNNKTKKGRDNIIKIVKNSSVLSWAHVNLHGEYDFNNYAANDLKFNLDEILELNIA